jgi:phytol kinase
MVLVYDFVRSNFPTIGEAVTFGPLFLLLAAAYLGLAGYLKMRRGMHTGYTRKVFHFLVFGTACVLQLAAGTRPLCLFGACTSAVIFYALWRGAGHPLYEAMARESDAPRRTYFIVVPYLTTLIGGILANALFGNFAIVGYLVAGLGDAIGEPVGTRFGKHRYRVPGNGSTRSLEGSLAVCIASTGAAVAGASLLGFALAPALALRAVAIGVLTAGLEAVAPHGWDNAPLQIAPAFLASVML